MKTKTDSTPPARARDTLRIHLPLTILMALAAFLFAGVHLKAQDEGGDLPFVSSSDGSDGALDFPNNLPPLYGHAMAHDATRGVTVVFGGINRSTGQYTNDTYVYDGYEWSKVDPATKPATRAYHEMAWDGERGEIVMFGGHNGNNLGETWTWNGTNWTLKSPADSPQARYNFGMAFDDANNEIVLYGGIYSGQTYGSDTWTWNGTNWTAEAPADNPGGRRFHAMAYDSTHAETLLYGGYKNGSWNGETWIWNGTNWVQRSPATNPGGRINHALSDDPDGGGILFFGGYISGYKNDTWRWNGTNWTQLSPATIPEIREHAEAVYDANVGAVIMAAGYFPSSSTRSDTFEFVSGDWALLTSEIHYFDMTSKPNGIWNFTTIHIPTNIEVRFTKNAANSPVFWLATGAIDIDGHLNLDGQNGASTHSPGDEAEGGPGGFDGGLGGTRFDVSGSYAGAPGEGPGGGNPGVTIGQYGTAGGFKDVYGNASLNPLYGGSGGGGGASNATANGGNGGGGGGALLLASSNDITINGIITARGGNNPWGGASYGGDGSGGAIRAVADRVKGTGRLDVRSGANSQSAPFVGYIRIEGYYRTFIDDAQYIYPPPSAGAPSTEVGAVIPADQPTLSIIEVAGDSVAQPPSGSSEDPDVIFQEAGAITVVVQATNVPDGTPITLRITTSGQVINLPGPGNPLVPLSGGQATFTVFVPAGLGNIQAFAEFTPE